MIDAITKLPTLDVNVLQRILADIQQQSTGMTYATSETQARAQADVGKLAVYNQTGGVGSVSRIYFKDSHGSICYVEGTTVVDGGSP